MKRVDRSSHELIQKTISEWLSRHRGPLEASPLQALAQADAPPWLVLRLRVAWGGVALSREAFFQRARSTGVIHKLDLLALDCALHWLVAHPAWALGIVPISQYSLLVPGCVGQVVRRVESSPAGVGRVAIHVATHADLDFPEHLASVAEQLHHHQIAVTCNRFAPRSEMDAQLGLTALILEQRMAHQLGHSESSRVAVQAIVKRAAAAATMVIAPSLHSRSNRDQARVLGVALECARARDADRLRAPVQDQANDTGA